MGIFLRWVWDMLVNRIRINPSSTIRVEKTTKGWTLHAKPGAGALPSKPTQTLTIQSEQDDYLVMTSGDLVAKPYHLRRSAYEIGFVNGVASANPQNVPNYPQGPFIWVSIGQRLTTPSVSNGTAYNEYINRKYTPGDSLTVSQPTGGVGLVVAPSTIMFIDQNENSRQWFLLINDCINGVIQSILVSSTAPFQVQIPPKLPL